MKNLPILKPKYWVGHHKDEEGVILESMSSNLCSCHKKMVRILGMDWQDDPEIEIILVELNQAAF